MSFIGSNYQNLNHDYLSEIYLTFPNNLYGKSKSFNNEMLMHFMYKEYIGKTNLMNYY